MLEISLVELYAGCPLWPEVEVWLYDHGFGVMTKYIYPGDYAGEVLMVRINGGDGTTRPRDYTVAQ